MAFESAVLALVLECQIGRNGAQLTTRPAEASAQREAEVFTARLAEARSRLAALDDFRAWLIRAERL